MRPTSSSSRPGVSGRLSDVSAESCQSWTVTELRRALSRRGVPAGSSAGSRQRPHRRRPGHFKTAGRPAAGARQCPERYRSNKTRREPLPLQLRWRNKHGSMALLRLLPSLPGLGAIPEPQPTIPSRCWDRSHPTNHFSRCRSSSPLPRITSPWMVSIQGFPQQPTACLWPQAQASGLTALPELRSCRRTSAGTWYKVGT